MATRWSSQEVLRGALVVPVEDLHKTRADFQRPPVPVVMPSSGPSAEKRYAEAQDELALMTEHTSPRSRNHASDRHQHKPMMRLLKASVIAEVERMTKVTRKEVLGQERNKRVWRARRLVYWGLHELMGCSHEAIAKATHHNYSTVSHGAQEAPIRHQNDIRELRRRCLP